MAKKAFGTGSTLTKKLEGRAEKEAKLIAERIQGSEKFFKDFIGKKDPTEDRRTSKVDRRGSAKEPTKKNVEAIEENSPPVKKDIKDVVVENQKLAELDKKLVASSKNENILKMPRENSQSEAFEINVDLYQMAQRRLFELKFESPIKTNKRAMYNLGIWVVSRFSENELKAQYKAMEKELFGK